jgi:hypothetical protein
LRTLQARFNGVIYFCPGWKCISFVRVSTYTFGLAHDTPHTYIKVARSSIAFSLRHIGGHLLLINCNASEEHFHQGARET